MKKILLIASAITFFACAKTEIENDRILKDVKYTLFSEKGIINLKYYNANLSWTDTVINSQNAIINYKQSEDNFSFVTQLKCTGADSLFIKAECEGKKLERGYRSTSGTMNLSLQLNQLK